MAGSDFIKEARTRVRSEVGKSTAGIRGYVQSFTTSRVSMALSALLVVAFSTSALYSPERLPPIAPVGLTQAGLIAPPPSLDLSTFDVNEADVRAQTQEAASAAKPYVQEAYDEAHARIPKLPLWLNIAGAVLSLAAFAYTTKIQVRAAKQSNAGLF
jgi:hypothetical protein